MIGKNKSESQGLTASSRDRACEMRRGGWGRISILSVLPNVAPDRDLESFPFYCFPLFLCTDHLGKLSYLSLLFFGTRHSDRHIRNRQLISRPAKISFKSKRIKTFLDKQNLAAGQQETLPGSYFF